MEPTSLRGERVELRPPTDTDAEGIAAAINDPDIPYWIDVIPWPYTVDDARHFIHEVAGPGWDTGHHPAWLVFEGDGSRLVGTVGLTHRLPGVYEVGYWLTPTARGRGLITEAVRLVCVHAFTELHAQRIEWQAAVGNLASRAVAERTGFRIEGKARARLRLDGTPHDSWFGSLLPDESMGPRRVPIVPREPIQLIDARLTLRAPDTSLVDWVLQSYQDPDVIQWNPADVVDEKSALQWIQSRSDWSDGTHASWVVTETQSSRPLGAVSLHKVNDENRTASIGYWTLASERGKGFASDAVGLVTEWALAQLKLRRVELLHAVANPASCAIAKRNGFALEGTVRQGERYGDGQWYDEHVHGRVAAAND